MAVMIAPRDDDKVDSPDTGATDMGSRVTVLEVKVDGLGIKMDERFEQVDKRFERVEGELREQRQDMKAGFEKLNDRFDRMQWTLIAAAAGIIIALIGAPYL